MSPEKLSTSPTAEANVGTWPAEVAFMVSPPNQAATKITLTAAIATTPRSPAFKCQERLGTKRNCPSAFGEMLKNETIKATNMLAVPLADTRSERDIARLSRRRVVETRASCETTNMKWKRFVTIINRRRDEPASEIPASA